MDPTTPVIQTNQLTRRFGDTVAVNNLSLTVNRGEVFGFLGHNGAGKTTTVRLLNGILEPNSGEVEVLGLTPARDGAALRARTGVLTETPSLDERLSARDNLTIYADLYGVALSEVRGRVDEMLATFDLADRASERVGGYSKGMKQRLALARAFLHRPELLFLDEPTSGLDPVSTRQVHDMVRRISQEGHTVFMCTHNLTEAQRLCHRVAVLEHGRMVAVGTPEALARQLGTGERVEIEVERVQIQAARAELRQLEGVQDVKLSDENNGARLIVSLDGRERIPQMLAHLVQQDVRVYRLSPLEASLEDIYFALHDGQGRTTHKHTNPEAVR